MCLAAADILGYQLIERAVFLDFFETIVDFVQGFRVALLHSDGILLGRCIILHQFQGIRILGYKVFCRILVNDNGIDTTIVQSYHCIRALLEALHIGLAVRDNLVIFARRTQQVTGRALLYADFFAIQVRQLGDIAVLFDNDALGCGIIAVREIDGLLTVFCHGPARDNGIQAACRQRGYQRLELHIGDLDLKSLFLANCLDDGHVKAVRLSVVANVLERRELCVGANRQNIRCLCLGRSREEYAASHEQARQTHCQQTLYALFHALLFPF